MKKQILITLLPLIWSLGHGQTSVYHPFPDSNAVWRVYCEGYVPGYPNNHICTDLENSLTGDTIIGAYTYRKIWTKYYTWGMNCSVFSNSGNYYAGAIRQDLAQKKVYYLPLHEIKDTLLYDFNLIVGDTLPISYTNDTSSGFKNYVSLIDSILIGNSYRKRFWISNYPPQYPSSNYVALIEGIGSTFGLLNILVSSFDTGCELSCFTQDTHSLYPDTTYNCGKSPLIIEETKPDLGISLYPNPFYSYSVLNANQDFNNVTLTIYNSYGQEVKQIINITGKTYYLYRDNLPCGLYFIRMTEDNNILSVKKIIITDN